MNSRDDKIQYLIDLSEHLAHCKDSMLNTIDCVNRASKVVCSEKTKKYINLPADYLKRYEACRRNMQIIHRRVELFQDEVKNYISEQDINDDIVERCASKSLSIKNDFMLYSEEITELSEITYNIETIIRHQDTEFLDMD